MSKIAELISSFDEQVAIINTEKEAVLAGKKQAGLRLRKATLAIDKISKELRAETIAASKK